jgi:hypothetical protein
MDEVGMIRVVAVRALSCSVIAVTLGAACDGGETPSSQSTGTQASSSTAAGASSSGGGEAGAGPCSDYFPGSPPSGVPAGWVRPPCAPASCDIFIAPAADKMRPAPAWSACGDGCLELVPDWAGPQHRFLEAKGFASQGDRFLGITQDLDGPLGLQILRVDRKSVV